MWFSIELSFFTFLFSLSFRKREMVKKMEGKRLGKGNGVVLFVSFGVDSRFLVQRVQKA